eukprot:6581972-Prymnesium_polylepis.3
MPRHARSQARAMCMQVLRRCGVWQTKSTGGGYSSYRVRTLWCETLGIPPDAGSLLRLPLLLDGGIAPLWGIAPAKTLEVRCMVQPLRVSSVGTWRSDLLCQKWSDPRIAATQDVGRVVRPDRAP